jgi:2-iminobutanoate/2-iminopropanoate deaminase
MPELPRNSAVVRGIAYNAAEKSADIWPHDQGVRMVRPKGKAAKRPAAKKVANSSAKPASGSKHATNAARSGSRFVNRPGRPAAWPFSDAAWVGQTLYVSGHLGLDPATGQPPAEPEEEARLLLDGIVKTLAAAGLTMNDLVWVQIYCSDVSLFTRFNDVYRGYFKQEFPARAFLGSGPLLFGCRFEVLGIAAKQ